MASDRLTRRKFVRESTTAVAGVGMGLTPNVSALVLAVLLCIGHSARGQVTVSVVSDRAPGPGGTHGLNKIEAALKAKGVSAERTASPASAKGKIVIVAGLASGSGPLARLLKVANVQAPTGAESLVIRRAEVNGKPMLLVAGADDRGLMYAELDVADRIGWSDDPDDPLREVRDVRESPAVPERALTKFVMNKSEFERYCFSEEYWAGYLDMLAANRYNTFHLLFGYFTQGYFEPIYPYLFDVDGFSGVRVVGLTAKQQQRNLDMLNRIIAMTHERGLDFTLGLWTHIHRAKKPEPGVPFGITDDNLIPYTQVALAEFLRRVRGLDAIQFRVHTEAALNLPQQADFWRQVFTVIKESGQDIRVDMRAKGFTDDMIDAVLPTGVPMRMTTKFWGEQMGPPYHPTHLKIKNQFKRRHSYADLLGYPHRYKMHWRLWNHGTTRMLLWADPEYVRRYARSAGLWDGDGYEVQEPLAMKMSRHRDEPTFDLLTPAYRHYRWEYERYWHFYQVFGRLGYNPATPPEVWQVEFARRFGSAAAPYIEQAVHRASQILPRIVAYNLPNLSADITWAEKMRWHDLPVYINNGPIDTAQFVGIEEAARLRIAGEDSPKIWPDQTRRWFDRTATEIDGLIAQAEAQIGRHRNKEFASSLADLKILAALARYHARRTQSGVNYAAYVYTDDLHALDEAISYERRAIEAWEGIVEAADGVYHDYLAFGRPPTLAGHWTGELVALRKGLAKLEQTRRSHRPKHRTTAARFDFGDVAAADGYKPVGRRRRYDPVRGGYGWAHAYTVRAPAGAVEKARTDCDADFVCGPNPSAYAYSAFVADMPNGHYELTLSMKDSSDEPASYGPMWIVANGMDSTGPFTVPAGQRVEKTVPTTVTDGRLNVVVNSASDAQWIINSLVVTPAGPAIAHFPIRKSAPEQALDVWATITGPDPITEARVHFGSADRGYSAVTMNPTSSSIYKATIPGRAVSSSLNYYIEAVDRNGRHVTYPSGGGVRRVQVTVTTDNVPPVVAHKAVTRWDPAKPLPITATVSDPSGVRSVRLRYRGVNQHQDFRTLPMLPNGSGNEFRAVIPAAHIRPEWDLMYLIEAFDKNGNGRIHPDQEQETPYVVVQLRR